MTAVELHELLHLAARRHRSYKPLVWSRSTPAVLQDQGSGAAPGQPTGST